MKFSNALDRSMEEIQRPPVLPTGNYIWQIEKHPEFDEFESRKTGDKFERVTFMLTCVEATDDVDSDELGAYGNVAGAKNRKAFFFNNSDSEQTAYERSLFFLKMFLGHVGLDVEDGGMTISEALAASVGQQVMGEITHRPDPDDPEVIYAEIGRTAQV